MPTTRAPHVTIAVLVAHLAMLTGCSAPEPAIESVSSSAGPRPYVSNEAEGSISVIDATSNGLLRTVPARKHPRGVRTTRDGRTVYVALSGSPIAGPGVDESRLPPPDRSSDGIGVVDTASGRVLRILKSGTNPEQFVLSSDERRPSNDVSIVDAATMTVTARVKVGERPWGVAYASR